MDESLPTRSFNLNLVNDPIQNLLPTESHSKVFLDALRLFPTIQQVTNPIIFLGRQPGGQLEITPVGIFFKDIQTQDFDKDLEECFGIINTYHSECRITELKQLSLRLIFYSEAVLVDGKRKLLTYDIVVPDKPFQSLPESKIYLGLRFVFTVAANRYDLKVEPRFSNLQENYIDFNVIIPGPIKVEDVFSLINEQRDFFNKSILPIVAR